MPKRVGASRAGQARSGPEALDWLAPLAAEMAGVAYWHYDFTTDHITASRNLHTIYGLEPDEGELTLELLNSFCHPDDRARLDAHRKANRDRDAEVEVRIVRRDGEVRHIITRSMAVRDEAGRLIGRYGALSDVTELKRAEAASRQSETRYRFIAEHAPDMITRVTPTGEILYVSPSCERVFGYTPEEHIKLSPVEMCHPDDLPWVQEAIIGLVSRRDRRLAETLCYRARHKNGHWIWVEANPILILDENGEPLEFVDIVRDVTQTKLFEAQLEEARARAEAAAAAKSSFLANMSHELRTPLTSIIGFAHLMRERRDLPPEADHYAGRIADASEALLAIINDVLDFSKLDAGQVALEMQPFAFRDLVEEAAGLIRFQAAARGVELRTAFDARTPPLIQGDVARLRQVMLNLLSNAVKFTDHGSVTVRTRWRRRKGAGWLRCEVIDTGAGIAPENLAHLFQRFSQADVSINRTHGGTGLGLAICKGIVELMGGRIGVDSRPGEGSTFWFEIPAAAAEAAPLVAPDAPQTAFAPLRILMVDDTAVNRELVRLMLQPLGLEVDEASGGAEGVQAAMIKPYDVILMDVRMPGVDGLEATRAIRAASELNRRTAIIALTADVQPENAAACRAAGMDAVLAKPIVPQQLLSALAVFSGPPEETTARKNAV